MILRNIVLCFILLSVLKVNSQEKISSFAGNDKSTKDLFTIVDDATKQTIVFFVNDLSLTASRFDVNLELVDNLTIPFQKKQLGSIKGTSGSQGSYYVYWSTYDGKEFIEQLEVLQRSQVSAKDVDNAELYRNGRESRFDEMHLAKLKASYAKYNYLSN